MTKRSLLHRCIHASKKMLPAAALLFLGTNTSSAQLIYGLSNGNLIAFNATNPGSLLANLPITGITAGQTISGMDYRPQTGQLYALGYDASNGNAQLYTIVRTTGAATAVNATPINLALGNGKIGFDFNPTVDRIRVVGSNNANYRLNPITGAIAATDLSLAFASGDVNFGTDPSVGAAAYTNSYIASTSTTLYDYDDSLNVFATQIPPNNGTLNTIGSSGISVNLADPSSDLDIYFNPMTMQNVAYFAANTGASTIDALYSVNLSTGAATSIGSIGVPVQDIACFISRSIPGTVTGNLLYAITSGNFLIGFDSNLPSVIRAAFPVTGITVGQTIVGMDSRPLTGQIYLMGYNSTTGESQLYVIDRNTGVATVVNATPVVLALGTGKVSFDFNPTVDRIRVVGSNNINYRLNPLTGGIAATDLDLAFAAGDVNAGVDPSVGTVAYTNSYIGSTSTTLYDYDDSLNVFATQLPPNNGTLNTVGSSGISVNLADPSSDLDIVFNPATSTNTAFFSANTGASANDVLYTVSLSTGAATSVGMIGYGIAVRDITAYINAKAPNGFTGELVYALNSSNFLLGFDSDSPQIIKAAYPVTGITAGQVVVGLDFRPSNKLLYALGYNSTNGQSQLYTVNRNTGAATAINATPVVLPLGTGDVGFDFNPVVDKIRVVGANGANFRVEPSTGAILATDISLAYASGDANFGATPAVGTVAYANSFAGATTTTLYDYDNSLNILATQLPPNNGTLNTIGSSGIMLNPADASADLDIYYDNSTMSNSAFLSANTGTATFDMFYSVDLMTGGATAINKVGFGIAVRDIAIYPVKVNSMRYADILDRDIDGIDEAYQLSVYPNPVVGTAFISLETKVATDAKIMITDLTGRVVKSVSQSYEAGLHTTEWNTSDMQAGIYFVTVAANNSTQTVKLIVQ